MVTFILQFESAFEMEQDQGPQPVFCVWKKK